MPVSCQFCSLMFVAFRIKGSNPQGERTQKAMNDPENDTQNETVTFNTNLTLAEIENRLSGLENFDVKEKSEGELVVNVGNALKYLSLIHISEPTRLHKVSRMPSSA